MRRVLKLRACGSRCDPPPIRVHTRTWPSARTAHAGTLSALKVKQISDKNGGEFETSWLQLGSANENELETIVKSGIKFSDIFEYAKPANGTCPQGFKSVNTGSALQECLKLKVRRQSAACWHVPISAGARWCIMGTCDWAAS